MTFLQSDLTTTKIALFALLHSATTPWIFKYISYIWCLSRSTLFTDRSERRAFVYTFRASIMVLMKWKIMARAFSKIYAYEQAYSLTAALWQRFYNGCQLKVCFCLQCHLSLKITLCNWSRQLLETETHLIWDFIVILFLLIHVTQ